MIPVLFSNVVFTQCIFNGEVSFNNAFTTLIFGAVLRFPKQFWALPIINCNVFLKFLKKSFWAENSGYSQSTKSFHLCQSKNFVFEVLIWELLRSVIWCPKVRIKSVSKQQNEHISQYPCFKTSKALWAYMIKCTHNCKGGFHSVFKWFKPGKLLAICRSTKSLSEKRCLSYVTSNTSHHIKKFQHYHLPWRDGFYCFEKNPDWKIGV